jgi:hypothetical protein
MFKKKRYQGTDHAFDALPKEIKAILVGDFKELTPHDLDTVLELDPLEIPQGLELGDIDEESDREDKYTQTTQQMQNVQSTQ